MQCYCNPVSVAKCDRCCGGIITNAKSGIDIREIAATNHMINSNQVEDHVYGNSISGRSEGQVRLPHVRCTQIKYITSSILDTVALSTITP